MPILGWREFVGSQAVMGKIYDGRVQLLDWWADSLFGDILAVGGKMQWLGFLRIPHIVLGFLLILIPCLTRSALCRFLFFCQT